MNPSESDTGATWHYRPGDHWAVVGPTAAALLIGDASLGLAERIWTLLSDPDCDVERVLDGMAHDGLAGLPSFVLVERTGEAVRALVRGQAVAHVATGDGGRRVLSGQGFRSWREEILSDASEVVLADVDGDAEPGPQLPLRGGIVRAAELRLLLRDGVTPSEVARQPLVRPSPEPSAAAAPDPTLTLDQSVFDPDGEVPEVPSPDPEPPQLDAAPPSSEPAPTPAAVTPLPHAGERRPGEEYLELLAGMTRLGTVEDAAVRTPHGAAREASAFRPAEPAPEAVAPAVETTPDPVPEPPPPAKAQGRAQPPRPATGLISSVPFASTRSASGSAPRGRPARRTPPPAPAPVLPTETTDEDDELTVSRAPQVAGAGEASGQSRVGWLPAVVCSQAHANPPESERCRVCGEDLSSAERQWVERPVIGHLRFEGPPGRIAVTGPMVIGRAPRVDRVSGDAVPTMVTVPSADGDISRSHLRIAVEGWHVMAIDLNATNGTVVQEPSGESRRLHPGEETMIVPGSRVILADLVGFVFEAQP
jgi:hypothetical protein